MKSLAVALVLFATASAARADDKELDKASFVFARGDKLIKVDNKGKNEVELATLPAPANPTAKVVVRALRTDPRGTVLLADLDGRWWWMPLDGSRKLTQLPCGEGPAQLPPDGSCVICRAPGNQDKALVVNLSTGKLIPVNAPALGSRIINVGLTRRVVYADNTGIWSIALADQRKRTRLAPQAPLRNFLPSPDGKLAVGVYMESMYENRKQLPPVETLTVFALDGEAARRKGIRKGIPLDWSHDGTYVLVQEGSSACLMRATGGEYKCYKGFTAVSLAPDGSYVLMLGNRDPKAKTPAKKPPKKPANDDDQSGDKDDDVPVALPTGPLALYRGRLDGLYDSAPILVTKIVDGAAVWVPGK